MRHFQFQPSVNIKFIGLFIVLLTLYLNSDAQPVHRQYLYWLRYQNQLIFSPTVYWNTEIDNRRFINPDVQNQLIIHSRLHFKKNRWDVGGGLTYSRAYAAKPEVGYTRSIPELRPVIEVTHEIPMRKFYVQNRIRIDNRFFESSAEQSIWKESYYVTRFRYRLQVRIPLQKDDEGRAKHNLRIADEIMFNGKKNTFDQNRVYITTDWFISKQLSIETGYIFIYQQRFGNEEFFSRHVLRFSLLHKIMLRP